VSGKRIEVELGFKPLVNVKQSVEQMIKNVETNGHVDLMHPRHYNIEWMSLLHDMEQTLGKIGRVF
jgi:hypothetical protein